MDAFFSNYFSSIEQYDERERRWFNEGPRVKTKYAAFNSSSISTEGIDNFRQGVELTQNKHVVGNYKISAGTPGHIINPLSFGVDNIDILAENYYKELDVFDPIAYIKAQEKNLIEDSFMFPIVTNDVNQSENYILNGIIEPLTIRAVASFFSIEFPFEAHATRGTLMAGNTDQLYGSSDRVLTVDYRPDVLSTVDDRRYINTDYFLDAFGSIDPNNSGLPREVGYFDTVLNTTTPFVDDTIHCDIVGMIAEDYGTDMIALIKQMSPVEENYITSKMKSSTSGFVYDGFAGTDSLAFGGMTY